MKTYTYENYENLINMIKTEQGLDVIEFHKYIREFQMAGVDVPVMRLIYDDKNGSIFIAFSVLTAPSTAVDFSEYIRKSYKLVQVTDEYFQAKDGTTYVGQEAFTVFVNEMTEDAMQQDGSFEIDTSKHPVSLMIGYPIETAWGSRSKNNKIKDLMED